ncbi:4a-hydroxytetrahydrobiopterin dehydratase [Candidatus Kaiserbacteria bacterium CG10_big_fil_rev_8_21_14_0_10_59_10]|uniref:Putative pterin-4-alpha-carbinolamine dehydratase n=1 Tax=Candidatus Kaiserbacteria bacterium CG10_big_fil_rev_8_21_14_0_10_59_10 TaxID=1974612 RepID=A0A2H0UAG0_9BACT|nr:MAG: 4a-hydroxytetrahydrobiopterin dehydratase [Candidatus Kaiserbacteria bacterium CG10_big_fil_rev_8_21_14_0_10_59_10]
MGEMSKKRCVPCEAGALPLFKPQAEELLKKLDGWALSADAKKITKEYRFKDFAEALAFANRVGAIAEEEGHHPDLSISWGKVGIELSTHAIGGLSENDFILAAKIDEAPRA